MAKEITAEIPGAVLTVIDDAGHLSNIEKPEEFNAAVLGFIQRHSGRS
jgi:pimeloyl-ACP methyl ester carboxylesterase